MGERASSWLLVVLVLAQLALLASRVPDPAGHGQNFLEGLSMRAAAVPAMWVSSIERFVVQIGERIRSRRRLQEENRALSGELLELRKQLIRLHGVEAEADRLAAAVRYSRYRASGMLLADIVYADHSSWLQALVLHRDQSC